MTFVLNLQRLAEPIAPAQGDADSTASTCCGSHSMVSTGCIDEPT